MLLYVNKIFCNMTEIIHVAKTFFKFSSKLKHIVFLIPYMYVAYMFINNTSSIATLSNMETCSNVPIID